MAKGIKGTFKAELSEWITAENGKVSHSKSSPLFAYTAYNEKPKCLVIHVSGPDDAGREKDVIIDIKSLVADLQKCKVIK